MGCLVIHSYWMMSNYAVHVVEAAVGVDAAAAAANVAVAVAVVEAFDHYESHASQGDPLPSAHNSLIAHPDT